MLILHLPAGDFPAGLRENPTIEESAMRKIQPAVRAYLQLQLFIPEERRNDMITKVFLPARQRFIDRTEGAVSMDVLARAEDVQVLVGFDTMERAKAYLESPAGKDLLGQLTEHATAELSVAFYDVD
jgi:hypothetical protein